MHHAVVWFPTFAIKAVELLHQASAWREGWSASILRSATNRGFLSLLVAKELHRCCGGVQKKHVNQPGSPVVSGSGDGRYICKICTSPFSSSNKTTCKARTNTRLVNGTKHLLNEKASQPLRILSYSATMLLY